MEDHEGCLWVGTRDGATQLTDVKFPTYSAAENLGVNEAWSVASSRQGGIWVGSAAGLTYLDGKGKPKTYSTEAGLPRAVVKRIFEASNGDVYLVMGEAARTLAIFSDGKVVATHVAPNMLVGMAEDAQGVIVSVGGTLYRVGLSGLTPYSFTGVAPNLRWVLNLAPARNGGIWVASGIGIFQVKDASFESWPTRQDQSELPVQGVCEDSDGIVWGWTLAGIVRLKENQTRVITRDHGLFDNDIFAIVPDDFGNLWVDSGRGIFRVGRQSMNDFCDGKIPRVECVAYDGPESVKTTDKALQERVACKTPDGRIWFPGPQGVVVIDPAHIPTNPTAPPVYIDRVLADGSKRAVDADSTVAPGKGELEFHFTALSFIAPQKIKFRYKLEGYDKEWVEAGDRRLAFYTNLKPGLYTFHVIAANADGVWNETGDTLRLNLLPHFYQATWFYVLCGGSLCAIVGGIFFWRIQHLNQRQRALQAARDQLEIEVQSRTSELATTNLSLKREIEDRQRTEEQLAQERDLLRALLDSCPDTIYFKDQQSRFVLVSRSKIAEILKALPDLRERRAALGLPAAVAEKDLLNGMTDFDTFQADDARLAFEDEQRVVQSGEPMIGKLEKQVFLDGSLRWSLTSKMPWRNPEGKIIGTFGLSKDVTELKQAEEKLAHLHRQLVDASRQAGMAEVATGVLHNVGNVLNSVNVSATLVADHVRDSKTSRVAKLSALFEQNKANLAEFLTNDSRGQMIPAYLGNLAESLADEQKTMVEELNNLRKNIEHIKEIVAMQQSYAGSIGVEETISIPDLVEDALRINAGSLARHEVTTIRDYQVRPVMTTDKHKIMQVLINLVRNAKYACDESGRTDKQITVRITSDAQHVNIAIIDNGVGIPAENLTRIFNHGFTTRKTGHGFGLHSGALAAKELGGALLVQSDGPGCGATFILALPYQGTTDTHS